MNAQTINQVQPMVKTDKFRFLRRVIRGNAVFNGIGGIVFLIGAESISELTGFPWTMPITIFGVVALIWAGELLWFASRPKVDKRPVWFDIGLSVIWVALSVDVLLFDWLSLTTAGKWTVVLLAEVVSVFAILQYIGIRRSR